MIKSIHSNQHGFTLIELMITVAIIGILAAIAYPNYQRYVIKSKRTDMMSEMHNIASTIESRKLAQGSYSNSLKSGLENDYPNQGHALYAVTVGNIKGVADTDLTTKWLITATPKTGTQMTNDGTLTLDYQGVKCRAAVCSSGDDWNK